MDTYSVRVIYYYYYCTMSAQRINSKKMHHEAQRYPLAENLNISLSNYHDLL